VNLLKETPVTPLGIKRMNEAKGGGNFTLFGKIAVNGESTHPLYVYLKKVFGGTFFNNIKWNFIRFLVSREGVPVRRYGPMEEVDSTEDDVRAELEKTTSKQISQLVKSSAKVLANSSSTTSSASASVSPLFNLFPGSSPVTT
jgi:hypothetical protein